MDRAPRLLTGILRVPGLEAHGLVHGFSTLELGTMRRSETEVLTPARLDFARRLGLDGSRLTIAGAVHGTEVARIDEPRQTIPGVDALMTDRPGLPLLVTYADCYPLVLYDPEHRAVVLAHAGWRGTAAGMAGAAVAALAREYGSRPGALVAGVGPGICGRCYEVGEEVAERFDAGVVRRGAQPGKFLLDLAEANRRQLVAAGLRPENVHLSGVCTKETAALPSHRRNPDGTRFAGIVAVCHGRCAGA